jgi:hypothetical protein
VLRFGTSHSVRDPANDELVGRIAGLRLKRRVGTGQEWGKPGFASFEPTTSRPSIDVHGIVGIHVVAVRRNQPLKLARYDGR